MSFYCIPCITLKLGNALGTLSSDRTGVTRVICPCKTHFLTLPSLVTANSVQKDTFEVSSNIDVLLTSVYQTLVLGT